MAIQLQSFRKVTDGLEVTYANGVVQTLTSADVPSNVKNKPTDVIEAYINDWLQTQIGFEHTLVRVNSVDPVLDVNVLVHDGNVPSDFWRGR